MLCFRQRNWLSGPTFVICSLAFALVFLFNCVSYYRSTQKYYRLQGYRSVMDDITYTMDRVERISNRSSVLLARIGSALHGRQPQPETGPPGRGHR